VERTVLPPFDAVDKTKKQADEDTP
jgi:hypothetical protein